MARAAQLLAVAALPVAVGLSGDDYAQPRAFTAGYRTAMVVCAGLFAVGGAVSWWTIRNDVLARLIPLLGRRLAYLHRAGRHMAVAATAVLLVGRIHVDLLRVCTAACPGC